MLQVRVLKLRRSLVVELRGSRRREQQHDRELIELHALDATGALRPGTLGV